MSPSTTVHVRLVSVDPLAFAAGGVVLDDALGEVLAAERALYQALVLLGAPVNAALAPARASC